MDPWNPPGSATVDVSADSSGQCSVGSIQSSGRGPSAMTVIIRLFHVVCLVQELRM